MVDVGIEPDFEGLVDPDVVREDEKFVSLETLGAIDDIEQNMALQ